MSGIVGNNLGRGSGLVKAGGVGADSVTGASIADDAIDSEHYTDGSIDNAHLADDAVGLAERASGTDGQIITYDASGNPTAVGPGNDGQVLTSTGAGSPPAFEDAAGGSAGIDDQSSSNDDQLTIKDGEVVINEDSDDLDFRVESNGSTKMLVVDGGGDRVLIGRDTTEGGSGELNISASHSTTHSSGELTHAEGGSGTCIEFFNNDTTDNNYSTISFCDSGGMMSSAIMGRYDDHDASGGGSLHFFTKLTGTGSDATSERIVINHQGVLEVYGETGTRYSIRQKAETDSGTHYYQVYVKADGSVIGSIASNSTNASFNTSSDYRLKENETAITDGIERVKQLKPYRFNWKTAPDETVDGFFAHEVTSSVPEAIQGEKDAMAKIYYEKGDVIPEGKNKGDFKEYHSTEIVPQQIDQSKLVPLLTSALQEAIAKIETLEAKVTALENA